MSLYINGIKTGGGNQNITSQSSPYPSVGNKNDLYFKTGNIAGYYHYVVSTASTSSSDAQVQVQEINASGTIVDTTTLHHESSYSYIEFDGHFKIKYTSPNWDIVILDDSFVGYETGDTISWSYESVVEYDLKIPVLGNEVTNQYIKIDNDWVEINNNIIHLTQAEYDALPDSKLNDDKIYMIEDVTSKEVEGEHYSTDEQIVGTWIDGSPVYQKTFVTTLPNSPDIGSDSMLIGTLTDFNDIIKIEGTIKDITANAWCATSGLPWYNSYNGWQYSFHINPSGQLCVWFASDNIQCYNAYKGGRAIATVQYTKTSQGGN